MCLFLVACSSKSQLQLPSEEENDTTLLPLEVIIEDALSGSSPTPDPQTLLEETLEENDTTSSPLYTIISVPPLDDEDALFTYFVGDDITSAFFYSEDEEIDTGALVVRFLYEYGLPTTTVGSYYLLTRTGDAGLAERANNLPIYTNDSTRNIQPLELIKTYKNVAKYHCFYCDPERNIADYD
ncbi:MAG: hypothetical protein LBD75_00575 [Candidatus Peribacteria bacterium]|nr:hypothetical protein [Candidatus Peribacteria bacterium]